MILFAKAIQPCVSSKEVPFPLSEDITLGKEMMTFLENSQDPVRQAELELEAALV